MRLQKPHSEESLCHSNLPDPRLIFWAGGGNIYAWRLN